MVVSLGQRRNEEIGAGVKNTPQRCLCIENTPRISKLLAINSERFVQ